MRREEGGPTVCFFHEVKESDAPETAGKTRVDPERHIVANTHTYRKEHRRQRSVVYAFRPTEANTSVFFNKICTNMTENDNNINEDFLKSWFQSCQQ